MKKILYILSIMLIFSVLIFETGCEKDALIPSSIKDNENMNFNFKSSQNKSDSLRLELIVDFLDSIDNNRTASIEYDSATYYLEASVNYHYGRANREYGYTLVDSFEVSMTMTSLDKTTYGNAGDTRDDIVDGLKSIYDNINQDNDDKFMVFADVQPITHNSTTAKYKIYASFAWGDYIDFDEDEPYEPTRSSHWQTEAPELITNAVLCLYGQDGVASGLNYFFLDVTYRSYTWNNTQWKVSRPEIPAYNWINLKNPMPPLPGNTKEYYIFWQEHYDNNNNVAVGIHNYLSGDELNFYTYSTKYKVVNHSTGYGHPGGGRSFCGFFINPLTHNLPNGIWEFKYHLEKHWFGKAMPEAIPIYQLELYEWI